ncbi:MAG: AAA family ATPase [Lewinellaceae bacterium]|nr:AAA family ATPase [Lewinellaceae bacterium]
MLILISGLPGSGKSTLAKAYVARFGGVHINSDLIRNELGLRGKYAPGDKEKVYVAMLGKVKNVLSAGGNAVVDSTFYKKNIRAPFEELAAGNGVSVVRIQVQADEAVIRQRLQKKRPDSEADFAVYEKIRDAYEPWEAQVLVVRSDTDSLDTQIEKIDQYIRSIHDR